MQKKKNRSERSWSKTKIVIMTLITCVAILILLFALWLGAWSLKLDGYGYLSDIQKAISSQCSDLDIVIGIDGYGDDLAPSWSSPGVYCSLDYDGTWGCSCR